MQQPQQQVQVIMQPQSSQDAPTSKLNKKGQRILGCMQICLGLSSFAIGVAYIGVKNVSGLESIGTGIWCGLFVVIPGVLGVVSAKTETNSTIVGCMVTSIFASLFGVIMFIMSGVMLTTDKFYIGRSSDYRWNIMYLPNREAAVAVGGLGVFVGVAIMFVAIVQSCFCCCAKPCCTGSATAPVMIYVQQPGYSGQVPAGFYGTVTPATGQVIMQPPYSQGMVQPPAYQGKVPPS